MIIKLHVNGTPLVYKQSDLTEAQRVFLEYGIADHINSEREFLIKLMGGKPSNSAESEDVRRRALDMLKRP